MARRRPEAKAKGTSATETVGAGGELYQLSASPSELLTTNQGLPISDVQNLLKAGDRGPVLLEDFHLCEKITHFDHERIPESLRPSIGFAGHSNT